MEKRYSPRHRCPIDIVVRTRSGVIGSFPVRNWTRDGLFIATGPAELAVNEPIWIDPDDDGRGSAQTPTLAVVVHRSAEGVGVLLRIPLQTSSPFLSKEVA